MGFNETSDERFVSKSLRIPKDIYPKRESKWKSVNLTFTQYVLLLMEYDEKFNVIDPRYFKEPDSALVEKAGFLGKFRLTNS